MYLATEACEIVMPSFISFRHDINFFVMCPCRHTSPDPIGLLTGFRGHYELAPQDFNGGDCAD
jgi:hypothetical protein